MAVAFAVRKDYEDKWEPGVISVADDSVDLAELLEQGGGQIIVADDQHLMLVVLDQQPALKRVSLKSVEDKARTAAADAARAELEAKTDRELREGPVVEAGIEVPKSATKQEVVDALVTHREANWTPDATERKA